MPHFHSNSIALKSAPMSMYPQPYYAPQMPQYYGAPVDALRPARRASLLMFIIGGFMILMSTCIFCSPMIVNAFRGPQADQARATVEAGSPWSFNATCYVEGAITGIPALGFIVFGIFVRRGGRTSTIISCVLVGLLSLFLAASTLSNLVMMGDPTHAFGACFGAICCAFTILQFVWLIQAAMASGKVGLAQQQYAAQYWQYQQTMQAYAKAGYGYQTTQQPPAAVQPPVSPQPPVAPAPPTDQTTT
jgi:hypothetical protein